MTGTVAPAERREYVALNGMRGVAAIAVMLFHGVALVGPVFPRGYLAVDLFFVLSGFVIAHAYGHRLGKSLGLRGFALVRMLRFWPLYAIGLGLGVGRELLLIATGNDYALSPPMLAAAIALGLVFLPLPLSRRGDNLFPLNVPSWSLFLELLVNLLYAVTLKWLSTAVLIVAIVISAALFVLTAPAEGVGHVGVTSQSFPLGCVRTILSFAIGILIHRHQHRLVALLALPTLALLVLVAAGLAFPWGGRGYDLVFILLLSPLLVAFGVAALPTGRIATFATWLGLVSFPLYAIHRPILQLVEALAARLPVAPEMIGWAAVAGLLVLAGLAHRLDTAARRRLSNWIRPPLSRDPGSAAAP